MKDYVLELVSKKEGYNAKLNAMREYLQAYILRVMHDEGVFRSVAFLGGTALRFLHGLPRFSEDLDFSLAGKPRLEFEALLKKIMSELAAAGYDASLNYNSKKTVNSAFVKFSGLMFEAEISPLKSQKFSIKIEIDSKPPEGAIFETQIVNKYFPISFLSYDINSLFAGKLHALLSRKYAKGRDYFDLMWYLDKGIKPNIKCIEGIKNEKDLKEKILKIIENVDTKSIRLDLEPLIEDKKF